MGARRAHRAAPPALALALLLLMAARAFAMYEDQAGTFDWHRQHIGEVLHAGHSPGRDRFYVATAQSLVAAVSAGDGSIAWRRAYNEEDPLGQIITLAKPAAVVAVSGGGRYVRAWEPARGALKWEAPGGAPAAAAGAAAGARGSAAVAAVDTAQVPAVAVHAPGTVQVRVVLLSRLQVPLRWRLLAAMPWHECGSDGPRLSMPCLPGCGAPVRLGKGEQGLPLVAPSRTPGLARLGHTCSSGWAPRMNPRAAAFGRQGRGDLDGRRPRGVSRARQRQPGDADAGDRLHGR